MVGSMNQENDFTLQRCGHVYNPALWNTCKLFLTNRIYYIIGGTGFYQKKVPFKKGYVYIFPADPNFTVTEDTSDPIDHIFFDFLSYQKLLIKDFIEIDVTTVPGLQDVFKSTEQTLTSKEAGDSLGQAYFELVTSLLKDYMPLRTYHSPVTQAAIRCIQESELENISVRTLAKKINVNEDHLIRCFRKDTGFTPHRYISLYKVDVATSMINRGSTMKEIADVLGFSSMSAFSTFYKNERHVPPSSLKVQ